MIKGGAAFQSGSVRALCPAVLGLNLVARKQTKRKKTLLQKTCWAKIASVLGKSKNLR